jgi:hypothetical protein
MSAMASVPWPTAASPTASPTTSAPALSADSRYGTLLQISIGQEDVDDVIARDVHRTFPEHAHFAVKHGQQALFRVLKAYSLHDLEVGYCQGMAFVAGLLLFYLPEEPAFEVLCRLMSEADGGAGLRKFYLPGLEGLKVELRALDVLLAQRLPNLRAHLDAHGAVPVLYASQWFLTVFSCPFPVSFACRLVDVALTEGCGDVLLRAALTVLAECETELLMQEDFEELLTFLKVEPVRWPAHRLRRVLDAAVHSPVGTAELAEARARAAETATAAEPRSGRERQGASGGVRGRVEEPRWSLQGDEEEEEEEKEEEESLVRAGGGAVESGGAVAAPAAHVSTSSLSGYQETGVGADEDDLLAELVRQQAELEDETLQMVLGLDLGGAGSMDGDGSVGFRDAQGGGLEGSTSAYQAAMRASSGSLSGRTKPV